MYWCIINQYHTYMTDKEKKGVVNNSSNARLLSNDYYSMKDTSWRFSQ